MFGNWEEQWRAIVSGKKTGRWAATQRAFLRVFSWVYRGVAKLRNYFIDKNFIRTHRIPDTIVISVGNLVAGGTGKTPVIIRLIEEFKDVKTAVLSRGYRSQAEHQKRPTILSHGKGPLFSAQQCGDEPYLIAQRAPSTTVVVGKNRVKAARMAANAGCQILLLDDGMQHRQLARDFEIVVLDAEDPLGTGYHIPRGYLREEVSGLQRADLVIINHVRSTSHFQLVSRKVTPHTSAPLVGADLHVQGVETLAGDSIPTLMGKKVGIFCGIGMPQKFRQTIHGMGGEIVEELFSRDHSLFPLDVFAQFAQCCAQKGAEVIVCTEKDRVKLHELYKSPLPIAWVKVGIRIIAGFTAWDTFIDSVYNRIPPCNGPVD